MEQNLEHGVAGTHFCASRKSQLAQARIHLRWTLLGVPVVYLLFLFFTGGPVGEGFYLVFGLFATILLLVEWQFHKLLLPGKPLLTLDAMGLEAPNLSGARKRLAWSDIDDIAVQSVQGSHTLIIKLRADPNRPPKRRLSKSYTEEAKLLLTPFSEEDQVRMLDAIRSHLCRQAAATPEGKGISELREQQAFLASFRALAPHAWMTYGLIAINVTIWGLMFQQSGWKLEFTPETLFHWGGNTASEVQGNEGWRLLTSMFVHGSLMHILMNMVGLLSLGELVERIYGRRLFLLIYLGTGLMGSATSLHFGAQHAVSVGASGAIFGLAGAAVVAFWQHRDKLPKAISRQMWSGLGFFVIYSLAQGLAKAGIDNGAHVGGLLGGCLLALILPERFDIAHFQVAYLRRSVLALLASILVATGLVATAQPAEIQQGRVFASQPFLLRGTKAFDEAVLLMLQDFEDVKSGKMTEQESDDRSRRVLAPAFRRVVADLDQVTLRPGAPIANLIRDTRHASALLVESLEMDSVMVDGKLQPADPARYESINAELKNVLAHIKQDLAALKDRQKQSGS